MQRTREFAIPAPYRSAFQRVAPGIHTIPGQGVGRVYVLEGADGLTLVDTGLARRSHNLLKRVQDAGHHACAVRRVLLTHLHADHAGGLPTVQANADIEVITSEANTRALRGRVRAVHDGESVTDVVGGLTVMETPGHTLGHVSFWLAEYGVLFAGDTVASWGGLGPLPRALNHDAQQTARDVLRLSRLNPEVICCGHGPPVTRNAAKRLRAVAGRD